MSYSPEATTQYAGLVRTSQSDAVALSASEKGANGGLASLDGGGSLTEAQAPAATVYESGGSKALDLALLAGSVQGGQLSNAAKTAALQSKVVLGHVVSPLLTKSGLGSSHGFDPGAGTYVGSGVSTKGVLGLASGAGAANEFDTATNKLGASASPDETKQRIRVVDLNNDEVLDGEDEVWAVQVDGTVHFFSGAFDATASVVSVPDGVQFKLIYKQRYDLSDAPEEAFLSQYVDGGAVAPNSVDGGAIIDGSVTTDELADDAVTQAKMADNSVGAAELVNGAVGTGQLANDAVTQAKMADDSVGATELIDGAVGSPALANDAVTQAKMADDSVGATELIDGAVGNAALANDAVTQAKMADDSIGNAELIDGSVTPAKADLTAGWAHQGLLTTSGGQKVQRRSVSGTVTGLATDQVLLFDTSAGAGTLNLPLASSMPDQPVYVKNKAGGVNPVTVDGNGAEQVEGGDTLDINPGSAAVLVSDGAAWHAM